ncbi:MAG: methionine adenosyltransferase [bacterium]
MPGSQPGGTLSIRVGDRLAVKDQPFEIVEKKGKGHPDSICDALMEEASRALNLLYREYTGHILHYNLDKGLLAAGRAAVAFGGGKVLTPLRMIIGDRATFEYLGRELPIWDTVVRSARNWISRNVRYLDPERHMTFQNGLNPGSRELTGIFTYEEGKMPKANDTSATVGFAPHTPVEELVLALDRYLNSARFREKFPAAGEDSKIMAVRRERSLDLTIALAMVDRFIASESDYFSLKEAVSREVDDFVKSRFDTTSLDIHLNTLDQRGKGEDGIYLTVTGTSAEQGDSGQVGRGNQVNGLMSLMRPQSSEASAGKNPLSHVGKIYNYLAYILADDLYRHLEGAGEVFVWLTSRIGDPVNQPALVAVEIIPGKGKSLAAGYQDIVSSRVLHHLEVIPDLCRKLMLGEVLVV